MKFPFLLALALGAGLLSSGCATTSTPRPVSLDIPGERRIGASDRLDIALAPGADQRVDSILAYGRPYGPGVLTGPIWTSVFRGDEGSAAQLEIIAGELRNSIAGLGFTMRWTYTVHAVLHIGPAGQQNRHILHATGSRAAALATASAMRQAVELGVLDLARQARDCLAAGPRSPAPPAAPAWARTFKR